MGRKEREHIVIPAHRRSHVSKYGMNEWFKTKNCPNRDQILAVVPSLYSALITSASGESDVDAIERAEHSDLEALAGMLAHCINLDQSLVDFIDQNAQDYPADADGWYAVCCAAGWLVIQSYVREQVSRRRE